MYTLKSIARRSSMLGVGVALLAATLIPTASVLADALNPLTERSLLLSSSAPGFQDKDGSGNSAGSPNAIGENYAPAGSGPNGKKTGETFDFKVSSSASIQAFTLKYCTKAAGYCQAPGNNAGDADPNNDGDTVDSTRAANDPAGWAAGTSDLQVSSAFTEGAGAGQFQVLVDGAAKTGWTLTSVNDEDPEFNDQGLGLTGKNNYVTLANTTGEQINNGQKVTIVFKPSESVFITNPGEGAFFVKINTYDSATTGDHVPGGSHNIDGGVTVANVMTDSIHITTKVLETMAFSVGTQNPDTQAVPHGSCDAISVLNNNRLNIGDTNAEDSLETGAAHDTNSYWRLSSNSSGGATVYYSGDTLRNTVGDFIAPIGAAPANSDDGGKDYSHPGTEQFGLALVNAGTNAGPDVIDGGTFPSNWVTPTVDPLVIESDYADGDTASISDTTTTNNAQFAFKKSSLTTPVVIAQENTSVISCATAKVRYIGNIAADTPAGVYTTKINFLAAPQY